MDHYLEHPWNVVSGRAHFCVVWRTMGTAIGGQWKRGTKVKERRTGSEREAAPGQDNARRNAEEEEERRAARNWQFAL